MRGVVAAEEVATEVQAQYVGALLDECEPLRVRAAEAEHKATLAAQRKVAEVEEALGQAAACERLREALDRDALGGRYVEFRVARTRTPRDRRDRGATRPDRGAAAEAGARSS